MSQYVVIETILIDADPLPPRLVTKSIHEFCTWADAAKFANHRPEFAIFNRARDKRTIDRLMQLPGE
jgi:hypothetical protein